MGVSPNTADIVAEAGADVLVAGSAVYGAENLAEAIDSIREKAESSLQLLTPTIQGSIRL